MTALKIIPFVLKLIRNPAAETKGKVLMQSYLVKFERKKSRKLFHCVQVFETKKLSSDVQSQNSHVSEITETLFTKCFETQSPGVSQL